MGIMRRETYGRKHSIYLSVHFAVSYTPYIFYSGVKYQFCMLLSYDLDCTCLKVELQVEHNKI
jgi:hypothetical protein